MEQEKSGNNTTDPPSETAPPQVNQANSGQDPAEHPSPPSDLPESNPPKQDQGSAHLSQQSHAAATPLLQVKPPNQEQLTEPEPNEDKHKEKKSGQNPPLSSNESPAPQEPAPNTPFKTSEASNDSTPPTPHLRIIRMRQPFKILIDIWGVLTPYSFRADLFRYIDDHLAEYLVTNFNDSDVQKWLSDLSTRTKVDKESHNDMPDLVGQQQQQQQPQCGTDTPQALVVDPKTTIASAVANVQYRQKSKSKNLMSGFDWIFNKVWIEGYRTKSLQPPLFADVVEAFRRWTAPPLHIKIYTFASGPWPVQKLFLGAASEEVVHHLTCGFDAFNAYKYDSMRYRQVISALSERDSRNLFYLTDSPNKATKARLAGLTVFVVRRDGNRQYKPEVLKGFTCLDSLLQFDFFEFQ